MISRFLILMLVFGSGIFFCKISIAQTVSVQDSVKQDSISLYNLELYNQHIQKKLDSLQKQRLEKELEGLQQNSKRAKELEAEIKQIKERDSVRLQQQKERIALLKGTAQGYPVAPFGDTLLMVYLKLGGTSPEQRAQNISERIERIYNDYFFHPDSIAVKPGEAGYELQYKGKETILVVTESDGLWYNLSAEELAGKYADNIIASIKKERAENSVVNWLIRIAKIIAVLFGAFLLISAIKILFSFFSKWLFKRREKWFKGVYVGKTQILTGFTQAQIVFRAITLVKWILLVIAIYLLLPLLFSLIPGTDAITNTLLQWILDPVRNLFHSILSFLPNLFTIGIIYFFTSYLVKVLRYFMSQVETGQINLAGFHSDFSRPTFNILRFVLYAFMLVIIFPYLPGSGSPAFQGVSVFIGVLLSLGSSSAINNIIAGIVITYMRPFKIGDRIKIGDITGDVLEKTMLVIKLRTIKNEEITIPNSTILSGNTLNYSSLSKESGLIMNTTITIGYDVPWRKVHDLLIEAALHTDGVLKTPEPFVWQTSLNDYHISYQLNIYTNLPAKQSAIYAALHANIQDSFRDAGVEILSPAYNALRSGADSTIPPSN
jgi:small-conductance mechanosensitive channel